MRAAEAITRSAYMALPPLAVSEKDNDLREKRHPARSGALRSVGANMYVWAAIPRCPLQTAAVRCLFARWRGGGNDCLVILTCGHWEFSLEPLWLRTSRYFELQPLENYPCVSTIDPMPFTLTAAPLILREEFPRNLGYVTFTARGEGQNRRCSFENTGRFVQMLRKLVSREEAESILLSLEAGSSVDFQRQYGRDELAQLGLKL